MFETYTVLYYKLSYKIILKAYRAPTLDEIRKILEYPDRRIKSIVYIMTSSGSRVGAWDYLRWGVIFPIIRNEELIAAKMIVYPGESHVYITFISFEAYYALKSWMKFRENSGELSNDDESWLVRNLWNSLMRAEN